MDKHLSYAEKFDIKYADQGGLDRLVDLYEEGLSNPAIGKHFGLTEQEASYALKKILGDLYVSWPLRKITNELRRRRF